MQVNYEPKTLGDIARACWPTLGKLSHKIGRKNRTKVTKSVKKYSKAANQRADNHQKLCRKRMNEKERNVERENSTTL
jgi:hypothetical protein